jgi:hypothetical protein
MKAVLLLFKDWRDLGLSKEPANCGWGRQGASTSQQTVATACCAQPTLLGAVTAAALTCCFGEPITNSKCQQSTNDLQAWLQGRCISSFGFDSMLLLEARLATAKMRPHAFFLFGLLIS